MRKVRANEGNDGVIKRKFAGAIGGLICRTMRVFLKDKINAALSFLTVVILFLLYVLFLRKLSLDSLSAAFTARGAALSPKTIEGFSDLWFLGGLLALSCITLPLGFLGVYVSDREKGILCDISLAPLSKSELAFAYFAGSVVITYAFCAVVFVLANGIFSFMGYATLSLLSYFKAFAVLLLCALASSAAVFALVLLIKSMGAFAAFSAITGIVSGFLLGAYMPMSVFPQGVRVLSAASPFYGGVSLLRGLITENAAAPLCEAMGGEAGQFKIDYGLSYRAFGVSFSRSAAAGYLFCAALFFLTLCAIAFPRRKRN